MRDETVVILATSCSCLGCRPWDPRILREKMEDAPDATRWSIYSLMVRCWLMVTPTTHIEYTCSAPATVGAVGGEALLVILRSLHFYFYTDV